MAFLKDLVLKVQSMSRNYEWGRSVLAHGANMPMRKVTFYNRGYSVVRMSNSK